MQRGDSILFSPVSATKRALISGGVAGIAESFVTMPFEVTKNRLQMRHGPTGIFNNMADTVKAAGPQGLYYGLESQLVQVAGKTAIRFAAFEQFKALFGKDAAFTATTLAGLTEAIVWVAPTERLKMLRQAEISNASSSSSPGTGNVLKAARIILERDGVRGMFLGVGPTAARQALANGSRFLMFEHIKRFLSPVCPSGLLAAVAGGCTGVASVVLTNPVDVIKTRVQAAPLGSTAAGGAFGVLKQLLAEGNLVNAMSVGMGARALKIGLGQAVIFGTYDAVSKRLSKPGWRL